MKLKDVDALIEHLRKDPLFPLVEKYGITGVIEAAPTIDAVPVVRCKDCKHYEFADNRAFGMPVKRCELTGFEDVDDNDFCSRGERKGAKNDIWYATIS